MKSRSKELIDQSIAAMVSAIEVYNKPDFKYREETFSILAINSWELLIKAKWLTENKNKINSLYVYEFKNTSKGEKSKKATFKNTRSGNPLTHSLDYLAKKMVDKGTLSVILWKNLQALIEIRDSSIHFINKSGLFAVRLQEIGIATLKNFVNLIQEWFHRDLKEFNFYLMPLSFVGVPATLEAVRLNNEEQNYIHFIEELENNSQEDTSYSITVNIDIRFIKSKAKDALNVQISNDPSAIKIRMTEEQIKNNFPWDHAELVKRLQGRYSNFKQTKQFNDIKRKIHSDKKLTYERFLDPDNSKSSKKRFYNPNVITEFDKCYIKK